MDADYRCSFMVREKDKTMEGICRSNEINSGVAYRLLLSRT